MEEKFFCNVGLVSDVQTVLKLKEKISLIETEILWIQEKDIISDENT